MKFRLIYNGPLRATQRDKVANQKNPLAAHKHEIRKVFHTQLRQLWKTNKFLNEGKLTINPDHEPSLLSQRNESILDTMHGYAPMDEAIALKYQNYGYKFVPLVRDSVSLLCYLNILFLRRDIPGSLVTAGDIDNRIKTIIDALRMPQNKQELIGYETPGEGEEHFYCLLEDDKHVTQLSVETDTLLSPFSEDETANQLAHLVITVELHPYFVTLDNVGFV